MITSYHVHSTFSDGRNTIPEIVTAAAATNLQEIGISDHFVLLPDDQTVTWSMSVEDLPKYFDTIAQAADSAPTGLAVKRGMEIDFEPHTVDRLPDLLAKYPLDYVIGSVHFFGGFPIDECRERWDQISERERDEVIRGYWSLITRMAKSRLFDIAAHLDLYRKFGHMPTNDISEDILTALDAIAEAGMSVEINTSGWYTAMQEAYPQPMILKACAKRGIPVMINADAHVVANLTRDYDRAETVIRNAGYTHTATYSRRQATIHPLP